MDAAHPLALLSKLNEQRCQGLFCDVTIVVEDVKFRAHKNILAACSGYFRNALTSPEMWSSGQVLELLDLKSEVFASILNFIYCSKVAPPAAEDAGGLMAAGKRLGIPFLERLAQQEPPDPGISPSLPEGVAAAAAPAWRHAKSEEADGGGGGGGGGGGARGPRITNAFSITEACPGGDPFTPLLAPAGRRTPVEAGRIPAAAAAASSGLAAASETTHTLSEHSYAVNQASEETDAAAAAAATPQPKQLMYRNAGPLKKRHRLRGTLGRSLVPHADTPTQEGGVAFSAAAATPPPLFSEAHRRTEAEPPASAHPPEPPERSPPTLSPRPEGDDGGGEPPLPPAARPLLAAHAQLHRKRFVSHLFCQFCRRKFIHLKRLRNHEQVCPRAAAAAAGGDVPGEDGESEPDEGEAKPLSEASLETGAVLVQRSETPSTPPERTPQPIGCGVLSGGGGGGGGVQRRYNCGVCKRVYVTPSSLKRHENVHSWQRAYPCHYCNKVFALAEYRTKHEIWHTGERRYQCIFCLETFMTYYILKNHQKSFHGIDPSLAVRGKSANGGLKASVYPIKLYRLLPMKFRKRQYKTYSHTYAEGEAAAPDDGPLIPPFEGNAAAAAAASPPDGAPLPLTFMATTKMVAPVTPCISVEKPRDREAGGDLDDGVTAFVAGDGALRARRPPPGPRRHAAPDLTFLNSLDTVKKLGELSASAKRVEDMTKELLRSETLGLETTAAAAAAAKTETYIAKPACPGPSADGGAMPLCQITVKIGNEAIIRRRIKGSKLFPRKKRRLRDAREEESSPPPPPPPPPPESPKLRLRADLRDPYDDPNDCDAADQLWRPYYSYKAKKKRKKLRFKHRQALFHLYPDAAAEAPPIPRRPEDPAAPPRTPRTPYSCDICHSCFITETGLRAHVIGSHPCFCRSCGEQGPPGEATPARDYVCGGCVESGGGGGGLDGGGGGRRSNPEKRYRCSFCPQRFLYLATKRSHEKKHQDGAAHDGVRPKFPPLAAPAAFKREHLEVKLEPEQGEHLAEAEEEEETFQELHHPLKVKHKVSRRRLGPESPAADLGSGPAPDGGVGGVASPTPPRPHGLHDPERTAKIFKSDLHRPDRRLFKEEPFF